MRRATALVAVLAAVQFAGCGGGGQTSSSSSPATTTTTTAVSGSPSAGLPGQGRPSIVIGDKNFTEQFILGQLYQQALHAQGYDVALNPDIGPTEVTIPALQSGRITIYPEYLTSWTRDVAGIHTRFRTAQAALGAGAAYARGQGLRLLAPTPFSDTAAVAVTPAYAAKNGLRQLADLRRVGGNLVFGSAPQFQTDPNGLPLLQSAYGFSPINFTSLEVGAQYGALVTGQVQAAEVGTTDGQLTQPEYQLLADPDHVFGFGNVVPVVSARALLAEGPAFAQTIERVDRLLTLPVMRALNAAVDLEGQTAAAVAQTFLVAHGLVPPPAP
jgi:osmoprotectant transport system substrate-binding protein